MRTRKGLILLVLLCAGSFAWAEKEITASISLLVGKVEVRKAGKHDWAFARQGQQLLNNDMLRSNASSRAELKYSDGSTLVVRENSQVLLNATVTGERSRLQSKYVTTFFGAVYFVVKEAMPKTFVHRVYTPTAVVSIRGTSFAVEVEPKTGLTDVSVTSGTVLVNNILMSEEFFVKAGYKTQVALNQPPVRPRAIQSKDLEGLSIWVSSELLQAERAEEVARAGRNATVITGKAADRIVLTKFADLSGFGGNWDIALGLTKMIGDELKKKTSAEIQVVADAKADPDELGRTTNARWVITGEIETFELNKEAEISVEADKYTEFYKARIGILLSIVDPQSGSVVRRIRLLEDIKADDTPANDWKTVGTYPFDLKDKRFKASVVGRVVEKALKRISLEAGTL